MMMKNCNTLHSNKCQAVKNGKYIEQKTTRTTSNGSWKNYKEACPDGYKCYYNNQLVKSSS